MKTPETSRTGNADDLPASTDKLSALYAAAASLIHRADSLIICAGAGMGIDSGLPDFRGARGFWKAYPGLGKARMRFAEIASPTAFRSRPTLAWGFYGHRLNLYRATQPHDGFRMLMEIAAGLPHRGFVFTSNVDAQFQQAGFLESNVVECHGSIHFLQCLERCSDDIWPATDFNPVIDEASCRIVSEMPCCIHCGALARPAILMFNDDGWNDGRTRLQTKNFASWRQQAQSPVVIEIGAGRAIATVREFAHDLAVPLIRVNPTEYRVPRTVDVGIPASALAGVTGIRNALVAIGRSETNATLAASIPSNVGGDFHDR